MTFNSSYWGSPSGGAERYAKVWDINSHNAKMAHKKVLNFIVQDNKPFSTVEGSGFIDPLAQLEPRYPIPSRNYITKMVDPYFDEVMQDLQERVNQADSVAFSSDIWNDSHSKNTFMSLSGHWITDDFQLRDFVLHATHFPEAHSAINISDRLTGMFDKWSIEAARRSVLVRDGASNVLSSLVSLFCLSLFFLFFIL